MAEGQSISQLANMARAALRQAQAGRGGARVKAADEGLRTAEQIRIAAKGIKDPQGARYLQQLRGDLLALLCSGLTEIAPQLVRVSDPGKRRVAITTLRQLIGDHGLKPRDIGITDTDLKEPSP
ncbi:MAG: hypothetical protein Q7S23_00505 [bacterium]|nr:hypothetical protein [bacterium]